MFKFMMVAFFGSIIFATIFVIKLDANSPQFRITSQNINNKSIEGDCINGFLYLGAYSAKYSQVIGTDGLPVTCEYINKQQRKMK